jgi:hypothetical protein
VGREFSVLSFQLADPFAAQGKLKFGHYTRKRNQDGGVKPPLQGWQEVAAVGG